jgi:hypothetical protein
MRSVRLNFLMLFLIGCLLWLQILVVKSHGDMQETTKYSDDILLLIPAIVGAGAVPDYTSTAAAGLLDGASDTQLAFIKQRGLPDLFTISFITDGRDREGYVKPLKTPRRIDTWMYDGARFKSILFDNGYFVEEKDLGPGISLKPTQLKPTQFFHGMNFSQVTSLFGSPSCEEYLTINGTEKYRILKYNPTNARPPFSFGIKENGGIVTISAGYILGDASHDATNVCSH